MKAEVISKIVRNKLLLYGATGTGKTHCALKVAFYFSEKGKSVHYLDPEFGSQKEIYRLLESGKIKEEHIENITMFITPSWKTKDVIDDKENGVVIGGFANVFDMLGADLVIIDSMNELMRMHKIYLEQKFIGQGYYIVKENEYKIKDKETFTLPWNFYVKIYDELVEMVYKLILKKFHFICTMHPIGDTDTRKKVEQDIFKKFDTVIETHYAVSGSEKEWYGIVMKNRGADSHVRIDDIDHKIVKMFSKVVE